VVHDHAFINEPIPPEVNTRLEASTNWLWNLVDPETGRVTNLGHNDGAYILPLTVCPYHDYRPVIHAAAQTFLQTNLTPKGSWCDMSHWLSAQRNPNQKNVRLDFWRDSSNLKDLITQPPYILQNPKNGSWVTMRAARFHSRPAHADQLHLDLWWHGVNIAQDPGTYLYNAAPPWDNSLTNTAVHNTVMVDNRECMLRAGRFLYLEWAQAEVGGGSFKPGDINLRMMAQHNGYRGIGVLHQRIVIGSENGHWNVTDHLDGSHDTIRTARLHWLLPDWDYEIHEYAESTAYPLYDIRILSPYGWITLKLGLSETDGKPVQIKNNSFQLVRAGKLLYGSGGVSPIAGWTSPTYGVKIPALACILEISQSLPIELKSEWIIPNER
jgi:Heparinase II/III-like protein